MKQTAFVLIICQSLLSACSTSTMAPGSEDSRPRAWLRDHANVDTTRVLRRDVVVKEDHYTLNDVADLLDDQLSIDSSIDWDGLAEIGITPDKKCAIQSGVVQAERFLSSALWHLAPQVDEIYPTYMLVDGQVIIGTNASLVRRLPQVNWPDRDGLHPHKLINKQTRKKLQAVLRYPNTSSSISLRSALIELSQKAKVQVDVDWASLNNAGIDQDMLVWNTLEYLTGEAQLEFLLRQASADLFDGDRPAYTIDGGIVRITTTNKQRKQSIQAIEYNVRDLLERTYGPTLQAMYEGDAFALERLRQHDLIWRVQWLLEIEPDFSKAWPYADEFYKMHESEREAMINRLTEHIQKPFEHSDFWLDHDWRIRFDGDVMTIYADAAGHSHVERVLRQQRRLRHERMLGFMREVEAARWLKKAVDLQRQGELETALDMANQAFNIDRGNSAAIVMRLVLKQAIKAEQDRPTKQDLLE